MVAKPGSVRRASLAGLLALGVVTASPAGVGTAGATTCPAAALPCQQRWLSSFSDAAPVYGWGDFDGNGADDLLVIAGGALAFWYGRPGASASVVPLAAVSVTPTNGMARSLAGTEPVIGDFDGDGLADVLWASQRGAAVDNGQVWYGTPTAGAFLGAPAAWTAHDPADFWTVGDFDGDGGDDVLWYGETTGDLLLQLLHGGKGGVDVAPYPDRRERNLRLVVGDLDGNAVDDVVFYNATSGVADAWYFAPGGGIEVRRYEPGRGFRLNAGDFDGDGRTDLLWHGPGEQIDAYWFGTAEREPRGAPAPAVDGSRFPVVADLDGDGRDDVLWWDGAGAEDTIWLTRPDGPYPIAVQLGAVGQVTLADIDGDGAADPLFTGVREDTGRPTTWALWWLSGQPPG